MRFPYSTTSCQLAIAAFSSVFVVPSLSLAQSQAPAISAPSAFHEPAPLRFDDDSGFEQIFDGVSLRDWEGDPAVWRVIDGAIVGEATRNKPVFNTYIWRKGLVVKNFDLKLEIKCEIGGGSGIQYRSQTGLPWLRPLQPGEKPRNLNWMMTGPQADIWFPVNPQSAATLDNFILKTRLSAFWPGVVRSSRGVPMSLPRCSACSVAEMSWGAMFASTTGTSMRSLPAMES